MRLRAAADHDTLDVPFELKSLDDSGALEGYAAVFGNLDLVGDVIEPGAFTKTIQESGGQVPILYQHDRYEPIGVSTELKQDRHGLFVKGQLNMEVQRARETRALLNQGAMQGLSIGYKTIKKSFKDGARRLHELGLKEFSPVTFPANPLALASVKAAGDLVWDPASTQAALRCELSEALNPPGSYNYWIRDIAVDGSSALVSSYDDDVEAWVVPFTVDADGDVMVAPFSDWLPAQQVWVQAGDPEKAEIDLALAKMVAIAVELKGGRELSARTRATLADTQKQMSALLETAEPATEATPDGEGAAKHDEEPAFDIATLAALKPPRTAQESD